MYTLYTLLITDFIFDIFVT